LRDLPPGAEGKKQKARNFKPQEHRGITEFFETRFLFWLEILAFIGRLGDGIAILQLLETRLPASMPDSCSVS
jgi:hypothetical protein